MKQGLMDAGARTRETLEPAVARTADLVGETGRQAAIAGRRAVRQARRSPVATALALAGLGAGLFLLLNARARTLALGAAVSLWRTHGEDLAGRLMAAVDDHR